jgi:hypothetical protein
VDADAMTDGPPACKTHAEIVTFGHPLLHFRDSLERQRKTDLDDKGEFNLHMSEWATACTTQALHDAIGSAPAA